LFRSAPLHGLSFGWCIVPIDPLDKSDKQTFSVDKQKKQMSNGHSFSPLDPMDTQKSNGKLEVHLTNAMSNGLLIFPSDILHRYWTCMRYWRDSKVCIWKNLRRKKIRKVVPIWIISEVIKRNRFSYVSKMIIKWIRDIFRISQCLTIYSQVVRRVRVIGRSKITNYFLEIFWIIKIIINGICIECTFSVSN
jgi:hypothetical protein